jgi:hypothetical protein
MKFVLATIVAFWCVMLLSVVHNYQPPAKMLIFSQPMTPEQLCLEGWRIGLTCTVTK